MLDIQLLNADARLQAYPDDAVIITDPVWPNVPAGLLPGAHDPTGLLSDVLANVPSIKRLVLIVRFDSDPRFFTAVPDSLPFFRTIILPYAIPGYIGRKLGGLELAYCFGRAIKSAPGRRVVPGMAPSAQASKVKYKHPCPRALSHMEYLVNWCSDPGETIIDPFMGAGTIGVAAIRHGRGYTGIEIDPEYFAEAETRINNEMAQGRFIQQLQA